MTSSRSDRPAPTSSAEFGRCWRYPRQHSAPPRLTPQWNAREVLAVSLFPQSSNSSGSSMLTSSAQHLPPKSVRNSVLAAVHPLVLGNEHSFSFSPVIKCLRLPPCCPQRQMFPVHYLDSPARQPGDPSVWAEGAGLSVSHFLALLPHLHKLRALCKNVRSPTTVAHNGTSIGPALATLASSATSLLLLRLLLLLLLLLLLFAFNSSYLGRRAGLLRLDGLYGALFALIFPLLSTPLASSL